MKSSVWNSTLIALSLFICSVFTCSTASAQLTRVGGFDFDSDTLGEHPDVSLSDGFFPTFSSGVANYTVESDLGTMTNQSLRADRSSGAGSFNFGILLPAEAQTSESLRLRFRFATIAGSPYMFLVLRSANQGILGMMTLTSSSILFSSAWGSQNDIPVGSLIKGESVYFDWTIDRVTGVQTLSLDGVVVVDALATGYHSPQIEASRLIFEGAFQSAMTVALDDVEVFAGIGTTPNATKSWGQVKTTYR